MKKQLILSALLILLIGCDEDRYKTVYLKKLPQVLCVEGVSYYTFGHGKAPAYNEDGSLKLCKDGKV